MYERTDRTIRRLNRKFVRMFKFDELNVLASTKKVYSDAEKKSKSEFRKMAEDVSADWAVFLRLAAGFRITEKWLDEFYKRYSPTMEYVFEHEIDRKRARCYEALMATDGAQRVVKESLRYWSRMVAQEAVELTDEVALESMKKANVKRVRWNTQLDGRECEICRKRDGKIYDIDKVPAKPHWNCRCWLTPAREGVKTQSGREVAE